MCKAVEDLCREAAEKAARDIAHSREELNKTIAFKMIKGGNPDEKILEYIEISPEELEKLRAEYNAGLGA